jgi:hypothetical protein
MGSQRMIVNEESKKRMEMADWAETCQLQWWVLFMSPKFFFPWQFLFARAPERRPSQSFNQARR